MPPFSVVKTDKTLRLLVAEQCYLENLLHLSFRSPIIVSISVVK